MSQFLTEVSADWQVICTRLHVEPNTIKGLATSNKSNAVRLNDALTEWLQQNYDYVRWGKPTWRKVVESVDKINNCLFEKIASKHLRKVNELYNILVIIVWLTQEENALRIIKNGVGMVLEKEWKQGGNQLLVCSMCLPYTMKGCGYI